MDAPNNHTVQDDTSSMAEEQVKRVHRLVADATELLASLRSKVDEVESVRTVLVEANAAAQTKLADISTAVTAATAARTQITDEQAVVASKSSHIQGAQEHADKVRAELDRVQTTATQSATEAEGLRARAQAATDSAVELLTALRANKATADIDVTAISSAKEIAKTAANATKSLADTAGVIDQRVASYEAKLAEFEVRSQEQLKTITELLPGATSAGLAHAFDDRRKTFLMPATRWQWLFVGSLIALILLALSGLWHVLSGSETLSWDELARLWIARLPIAGALVWLALHASRESALAKRLEEDYGYKAAIATSFQGFEKRMAHIGSDAVAGSPLAKLCDDTLTTLATPPGRIYDKHRLVASPVGDIAAAARAC